MTTAERLPFSTFYFTPSILAPMQYPSCQRFRTAMLMKGLLEAKAI